MLSLSQIGIRSLRNARSWMEDSIRDGNRVVTMREFAAMGPEGVAALVPAGARCYVSIDVDVLDIALVPGCVSGEPNGMRYDELRDTLTAIAARPQVIGFDFVEVNPQLDVGTGITAYLGAHTVIEFLGPSARRTGGGRGGRSGWRRGQEGEGEQSPASHSRRRSAIHSTVRACSARPLFPAICAGCHRFPSAVRSILPSRTRHRQRALPRRCRRRRHPRRPPVLGSDPQGAKDPALSGSALATAQSYCSGRRSLEATMGKPQKVESHYDELQNPALRAQMRAVLTGPECSRIDFALGTVVVNLLLFRAVAQGLLNIDPNAKREWDPFRKRFGKKTAVRFHVVIQPTQLSAVNGALFEQKGGYADDTFVFPWPTTLGWLDREATVVHETVHAGLDLDGRRVLRRDEEASARVAAEMYKILKTGNTYKQDSKSIDVNFRRQAEVALERGPGYRFQEDRLKFLYYAVAQAGYNYGPTELSNANGAGTFVAWQP